MALARRTLISIVVVLVALVSVGCTEHGGGFDVPIISPHGPAIVQIISAKLNYVVGETITIQLMIDEAANIDSVAFHLHFNEAAIQFVPPAVEGPFLDSDGAETAFFYAEAATGGELVVGMSRLNRNPGIYGRGLLATFSFQAASPGECDFHFTHASVKDPQARYLPSMFLSLPVVVN